MNQQTVKGVIDLVALVLLVITGVMLLPRFFMWIGGFFPYKKFAETDVLNKYAILIPARNESAVIRGILDSLKKQDYPLELLHIYVVVKEHGDKTIEICKKYPNITTLVAPLQKCKGDALDEAVRYINTHALDYDGFLIFDADNVASPNFVSKINDAFVAGYDIVKGNQNCKNWDTNWVSAASAYIFTILNHFQNKFRGAYNGNITLSGSGMLLSKRVFDGFDGWPFKTLTEDYEISVHGVANGFRTAFCGDAEFLDEAPISYKVVKAQRIRWVKGYLQANQIYNKQLWRRLFAKNVNNRWSVFEYLFGVTAIWMIAITMLWFMLANLVAGIFLSPWVYTGVYFVRSLGALVGYYAFMLMYSLPIMIYEQKRAKLKPFLFAKALLVQPILAIMYPVFYLMATFKAEVEWVPTPHVVNLVDEGDGDDEGGEMGG